MVAGAGLLVTNGIGCNVQPGGESGTGYARWNKPYMRRMFEKGRQELIDHGADEEKIDGMPLLEFVCLLLGQEDGILRLVGCLAPPNNPADFEPAVLVNHHKSLVSYYIAASKWHSPHEDDEAMVLTVGNAV